ncbi:MAG TPA: hypothetical protein VMR18_04265, partial [Candidatus Saccharimonadales bacterium]|nr:hypothetical protein [Candidatus Saccharimonadales bacterium]
MKKDPNLTHWIHTLSTLLPHLVEVLGILLVIGLTGYVVIGLIIVFLSRQHLKGQKTVFLELTPHASNNLGVSANTALVNVWHELGSSRTLAEKLLGQKLSLTPELVSSREQGIRYIMRVPARMAGTIEQQLNAHSASLLVKRVGDPLPASLDDKKTSTIRFKQSGDWAFPFNIQESLAELDSSSYITNALTKLEPNEFIAEQ